MYFKAIYVKLNLSESTHIIKKDDLSAFVERSSYYHLITTAIDGIISNK